MPEDDGFQYEKMVERALRGVVREALDAASGDGLPGEHHFYITFRTDHPEVAIPKNLRERYPNEMTIVLQHQFWNLETADEGFQVTLSFSNVPHRLVVPYEAVIAFADPSVRFGLQFEAPEGLPEIQEQEKEETGASDPGERQATEPADGMMADTNIVTLDTFRKK
jgi:hypothetical protein